MSYFRPMKCFINFFKDLGEGNQELDNIIASSLQQLESARAFYEHMQARVKKNEWDNLHSYLILLEFSPG